MAALGQDDPTTQVAIATEPTAAAVTIDTLPAELLLQIIPHIPYSRQALRVLSHTNSRLRTLIRTHETSLVRRIKIHQFPTSETLALFPSLVTRTYASLATLRSRLHSLAAVHMQWLHITSHGPDLHWLRGRWEGVHKAGLLLLYRLQDVGGYCQKVALLNSLPATSLACLAFKLVSSIRILRVYGPEPINGSHAAGDILARSDVELAFEECLLQSGPELFAELMQAGVRSSDSSSDAYTQAQGNARQDNAKPGPAEQPRSKESEAVKTLNHEIASMYDRQCASANGLPKPPTLTSCLRRAFAARLHCHLSENYGRMWELLSSPLYEDLDVCYACGCSRDENKARTLLIRLVAGMDRVEEVGDDDDDNDGGEARTKRN